MQASCTVNASLVWLDRIGMAYPLEVKEKAIRLRKAGYSIKEIAKELGIAVGTSSVWLRNVELSEEALARLENKQQLARLKSRRTKKRQKKQAGKKARMKALRTLQGVNLRNKNLQKVLCAYLYWAEGSKTGKCVGFTNSDPAMIQVFLKLLRSAFAIQEVKLRAILQIHEYHNVEKIEKFWSDITQIPLNQFNKSYIKPNTGKNKRENYRGCIKIRYYDVEVVRDLQALYTVFSESALLT